MLTDKQRAWQERIDRALADLPPVGTTEACPKCAQVGLSYRYAERWWHGGKFTSNPDYTLPVYDIHGRLPDRDRRGVIVRTCQRCGAEVIERPADQNGPPSGQRRG